MKLNVELEIWAFGVMDNPDRADFVINRPQLLIIESRLSSYSDGFN